MKIEDDTFQTFLSRNFANIRKLKLITVEYYMSAMMRLGSLLLEIIEFYSSFNPDINIFCRAALKANCFLII